NPGYSAVEFNYAYRNMERVYLVTLSKDTPSPFRPKPEGPTAAKPAEGKAKDTKPAEAKPKDVPLKVDTDGLPERILQLPVQPARYRSLASVGSTVYYLRGGDRGGKPAFQTYDLAAKKETALGSVNGYEISADGKKM